MSNKALFYMKDLAPRSVLVSDDTGLSDSIQGDPESRHLELPNTGYPYDRDKGSRFTGLHDRGAVHGGSQRKKDRRRPGGEPGYSLLDRAGPDGAGGTGARRKTGKGVQKTSTLTDETNRAP